MNCKKHFSIPTMLSPHILVRQGRLNPEIESPSAAELVHHLFPPLAFLMDACLDLFAEDVQREVATPFLTPASLTLLSNCLSSREQVQSTFTFTFSRFK